MRSLLADGTPVSPMAVTASACADYIKKEHPSVTYFGFQNHDGDGRPDTGECWYGDRPDRSWDHYGVVDKCNDANVGGAWANAVYRI